MYPEEFTKFSYIEECDDMDLYNEINSIWRILIELENSDWEIII